MAHIRYLWLLFFVNAIFAFELGSLSKYYVNDRVRRVVDLRDSIVREKVTIRANNTQNMALDEYYVTIPKVLSSKLSSFQVYNMKDKPSDPLGVKLLGLDGTIDCLVFKISLDETVQPKNNVLLEVKFVYIHLLEPSPKKIPQLSRQHVAYRTDIFFYSPYHTHEIKSTFRTPSSNFVNVAGGGLDYPSERSGDMVTYGPFFDIKPYSIILCRIHYEYKPAILTLTQLTKKIEVSHWGGNVAIEEHYDLRHDGAQLDKEFNRIEFQVSPLALEQTNVFDKLELNLPPLATDVYYRDEVGNVSTSHFRREKSRSVLELRPRFPLFGGWKTTWSVGYNVPIRHYVRYIKAKDAFILKANFVENLNSIAADEVYFKVVLPEGAELVNVEIPKSIDMGSIERGTHFTYFDSTGRPSITFRRRNVNSDHEVPILIMYKYSTLNLLQKPLVVSAILLTVYVALIIFGKLSYTIGEGSSALSGHDDSESMVAKTQEKKKPVLPVVPIEEETEKTRIASRKKGPGKRLKK